MATETESRAWDGSASNYTDEEYAKACVLDRADCGDVGDMSAKERYSLPIRAPGSDSVDAQGLAAAAQHFGQVKACAAAKRKAARRLVAAYRELDRDPPEALVRAAGESRDRPSAGEVETRRFELSTEGRKIPGLIPYGVESRDLGGWREVISPGALRAANLDELVARVDHVGVPIGRYPRTLELEEQSDGLHWSLVPPESRADLREAIERGDLRAGSWQMVVGRDRWEGDTRHVEQIAELRDVSIVSAPAYPSAAVEYRAAPNNKEDSMSESSPSPVGAEEARAEDKSTEERSTTASTATEVKVTHEPAPALRVEDRHAEPMFTSLTQAFRSRGFPAETASLTWGEFRSVAGAALEPESRAVTMAGTIDAVDRLQTTGGPLGYDQRYVWNSVPNVAVDAGVTSVQVFQQTARTLNAGTAVVRNIDATSNKPEVASTLNVTTVQLKQVAGVGSGIPNVYLEQDALASVVETDLRLQVYDGLDSLFVSAVASSGFQAPGTDNRLVSIRKAITTLRASGYTPNYVFLTPADSETIDTMVSGISGGTADFVFGAARFAPGQLRPERGGEQERRRVRRARHGGARQALHLADQPGEVRGERGQDQHEPRSPRDDCPVRDRADGGGDQDRGELMAGKRVKLRVVGDGIRVNGRWYHNGQEFTVSQSKAKELLKTDKVVKA